MKNERGHQGTMDNEGQRELQAWIQEELQKAERETEKLRLQREVPVKTLQEAFTL